MKQSCNKLVNLYYWKRIKSGYRNFSYYKSNYKGGGILKSLSVNFKPNCLVLKNCTVNIYSLIRHSHIDIFNELEALV